MRGQWNLKADSFTLAAAGGIDLFVYRWLPPGPCKAVVQIAHGLAEHAGRYARLAESLTAAGYGVYANDHRGHGRTCKDKDTDQLGFFAERDGWRLCIDDLWAVNRRIAAENPGKPIVLLGHSMGSALAEQFMEEHGDALGGVVLSGPNGNPVLLAGLGRLVLRTERVRLGPRGHSRLGHALTFGTFNRAFAPARTPFDWLSRDPAEVDQYIADPRCGFPATVQLWLDLLNGWAAASTAAQRARIPKGLPIYIIAGSLDPVSANTRQIVPMLASYRAAGLKNVQHKFYAEARHELFNETNRDEVTRDLIQWLDSIKPTDQARIAGLEFLHFDASSPQGGDTAQAVG
jgi:alpha-beta hydrolase superfamily lysophospholipase